MGQAVFSAKLVERWLEPRSVRSVALRSADDSELHPLLEPFGVEVIALEGFTVRREGKAPKPALREAYWRKIGGTLVERFPICGPGVTHGAHYAEAIILPGNETRRAKPDEIQIDGQDVVVVQTNDGLGMWVSGQAVFTLELLRRHFRPRSSRSFAVVRRDDEVIRGLYDESPDVEPVVLHSEGASSGSEL